MKQKKNFFEIVISKSNYSISKSFPIKKNCFITPIVALYNYKKFKIDKGRVYFFNVLEYSIEKIIELVDYEIEEINRKSLQNIQYIGEITNFAKYMIKLNIYGEQNLIILFDKNFIQLVDFDSNYLAGNKNIKIKYKTVKKKEFLSFVK